ncbi:MAG TPA: EamA family transporter [Gaiellaceae bacterium]|nr:EamA family transporter [Gaiellaceae bacterium]
MAVFLALGGALFWGVGDFLGGLTTRRLTLLTVLAVSQAAGLAGLVVWVAVASEPVPDASHALYAVGAGVAGLVGLGALYRGLAIGAMGIVAPISATSPVVPISVDLARGVAPSAMQWVGVALVLAGVVILSREPVPGRARLAAGAGLAVLAAAGLGLFFVGIDASAEQSAPWAVLVARAAATVLVLVVAIATSASLRPPLRLAPALVAIGAFDTGANVLFAYATTKGAVGIVSVLAALYPLTTILLARLVLGERLSASRRAGGAVALAGAALVAAG